MAIYGGGGFQQYNTPMGQPVMPSGFVFEGVNNIVRFGQPCPATAWADS